MRIQFDGDGITDKCPRYGTVDINSCRKCLWFLGEHSFDVECSYVPFDELPPETQEKLIRYWEEARYEDYYEEQ